jgi:hypothetical protein
VFDLRRISRVGEILQLLVAGQGFAVSPGQLEGPPLLKQKMLQSGRLDVSRVPGRQCTAVLFDGLGVGVAQGSGIAGLREVVPGARQVAGLLEVLGQSWGKLERVGRRGEIRFEDLADSAMQAATFGAQQRGVGRILQQRVTKGEGLVLGVFGRRNQAGLEQDGEGAGDHRAAPHEEGDCSRRRRFEIAGRARQPAGEVWSAARRRAASTYSND